MDLMMIFLRILVNWLRSPLSLNHIYMKRNKMDDDTDMETPIELSTVIRNCLQYYMNEIHEIVPDARDFLRIWRRRLRDILSNEGERYTRFLVRDNDDSNALSRHDRLLRELTSPMANTNSDWLRHNTSRIVNTNEMITEIERDLGVSLGAFDTGIRNTVTNYSSTVQEMFEIEKRLENKLEIIEQLHKWIHAMPVDRSEQSVQLQETLIEYIKTVYATQSIESDYKRFCHLFARFTTLRSLLLPLQTSDTSISPLCTICTAERVTYAMIPCGHTFCNSCCQKQRWNCYICRTNIRERLRIYFS